MCGERSAGPPVAGSSGENGRRRGRYPVFIARRFVRARRQGFISLISLLSALGFLVGVMSLIIALSLMTGFQQDVIGRISLGPQPPLERRPGYALTVVAASAGYPESSDNGRVITGLEESDDRGSAIVFHAGTMRNDAGEVVTAGGRVLAVTGLAPTLEGAAREAYGTLDGIRFEGMHRRSDIGQRGMRLLAATKED